jgi:hypothetical protein
MPGFSMLIITAFLLWGQRFVLSTTRQLPSQYLSPAGADGCHWDSFLPQLVAEFPLAFDNDIAGNWCSVPTPAAWKGPAPPST